MRLPRNQLIACSLALFVAVLGLACDSDSTSDVVPAEPVPGASSRLAYFSIEGDSAVIVIRDTQSGDEARVELAPSIDGYLVAWRFPFAISPDGTRLAFVRNYPNVGLQLRVVGIDGSNEHAVLVGEMALGIWRDTGGDLAAPRWSPDGRLLAFESNAGSFQTTLFVAEADGSEPLALFDPPDGASDNFEFDFLFGVIADPWSPDSKSLAFTRMPENLLSGNEPSFAHVGVYRTTVLDPTPVLLSDPSETAFFQSWSPDGTQILYIVVGNELENEIRIMNADGTDHRTIGSGWSPIWSPDGDHIVFRSIRDSDPEASPQNLELYRVRTDGSDRTRITTHPGLDGFLGIAWSPDSRTLAFTRQHEEVVEVWIAGADGSDPQLISSPATWPAWLP